MQSLHERPLLRHLSEVPEAMRYFGSGKVIGKLVITIEENS